MGELFGFVGGYADGEGEHIPRCYAGKAGACGFEVDDEFEVFQLLLDFGRQAHFPQVGEHGGDPPAFVVFHETQQRSLEHKRYPAAFVQQALHFVDGALHEIGVDGRELRAQPGDLRGEIVGFGHGDRLAVDKVAQGLCGEKRAAVNRQHGGDGQLAAGFFAVFGEGEKHVRHHVFRDGAAVFFRGALEFGQVEIVRDDLGCGPRFWVHDERFRAAQECFGQLFLGVVEALVAAFRFFGVDFVRAADHAGFVEGQAE